MIENLKPSRKWILAAAARPNFMKIAPLIRAIHAYNEMHGCKIHPFLVHTGQHYDVNMSELFFKDLNIPAPDFHLGVGSGKHGEQTGRVLIEFEKILLFEQPELVIVVGDVNSTIACSLAAVKLHIPVAHVEAGLRSFDRRMPEEINRIVTDSISDYLFTPSPEGDENLLREGIPPERIFLVGDIMVDSLFFNLKQAKETDVLDRLGFRKKPMSDSDQRPDDYCLLTLHRPSNVDNRKSLSRILGALAAVSSRLPVLFPAHPRTRKMIETFNLQEYFVDPADNPWPMKDNGIYLTDPFGYLDFLNLMAHARMVLTDSGGIQQETTVLNIPCITLRDTTERPMTLTQGTNVLVKDDPKRIMEEVEKVLAGQRPKSRRPAIWDGHAAERIVKILAEKQFLS